MTKSIDGGKEDSKNTSAEQKATAATLFSLPDELIILILAYLPPHIILEFTNTRPRFRRFLDDGQLWRHLLPQWQAVIILHAMKFEKKNFIAVIHKELNKISRDAQIEFLNTFIENTSAYGDALNNNAIFDLASKLNPKKQEVEKKLSAFMSNYAELTPAMAIFNHKATFRERFCRAAEISNHYISNRDQELAKSLLEIKDRQLTTNEFIILNNILNSVTELRLPYELDLNFETLNFNTMAQVLESNTSIKHLHLFHFSLYLLRSYLILNALIENKTLSAITIGKIERADLAPFLKPEAEYVENFSKAIEYLLKNNPRITRLYLEDNILDPNDLSCFNNLETFGCNHFATDSDLITQPEDQLAYRIAQIPGKPIKMELDNTVIRSYNNKRCIRVFDTTPSRVRFLALNNPVLLHELNENSAYFSNLEYLQLHGGYLYDIDMIKALLQKPYKLQNLDCSYISRDFLGANSINISLSIPELINIIGLLDNKTKLKIALSINTIDSEKKLLTLLTLLNNDTLQQIYIRNGNIYLPLVNYCDDYLQLVSKPEESAKLWQEYAYRHFPERRNAANTLSHAYNQNDIDWRKIYLSLVLLETIDPVKKIYLAPINHGEFALDIHNANIDQDFIDHLQHLFTTINITKVIVSQATFDGCSFGSFCKIVKDNCLIKSVELSKTKANKGYISPTNNERELDYAHILTRSDSIHEIIIDSPINVAKNDIYTHTTLPIPCSLRKLVFKNCRDLSKYMPMLIGLLQNRDSQLELLDLSNSVTTLEAAALIYALQENISIKRLQFSEDLDKGKILFALSKQTSAKVYLGEHSLAADFCAIIDWETYTKKQYSEICQHLQKDSISNWQMFCGLITILEDLKKHFQFNYELNVNNEYIELFLTRTNSDSLHKYLIKLIQPFLKNIRLKIGKISTEIIIYLVTEESVFSQLDLTESVLDMQLSMAIVAKAAPKGDLTIILSDELAKDKHSSLALNTAMSCPRVKVQFKSDLVATSIDYNCHSQEKRWELFLEIFKPSKNFPKSLPQFMIYGKDECINSAKTGYCVISAQFPSDISRSSFSIEFDFSHVELNWQNVNDLIDNIDTSIVFSETALGNDECEKAKNILYLINNDNYFFLNRIKLMKDGQIKSLYAITKDVQQLLSLVQIAYQIDRNNTWHPMLQRIGTAEKAIELAKFLYVLYSQCNLYYNILRIPDICPLSDTMITEIINICNECGRSDTRVSMANTQMISVAQAIRILKNQRLYLADFQSLSAKANPWEKLQLLAIRSNNSSSRDNDILCRAADILVFHLGAPINHRLSTIGFNEIEKLAIKNRVERLKQQTNVERFRNYSISFTLAITAIKNNPEKDSLEKPIQGLNDYAEICALYNETRYASGDLYNLFHTNKSLYKQFLNLLKQEILRRLAADVKSNDNKIELPVCIYNQLVDILHTTNYSDKFRLFRSQTVENNLLKSDADEMNGNIRVCLNENKLVAFDLDPEGNPRGTSATNQLFRNLGALS